MNNSEKLKSWAVIEQILANGDTAEVKRRKDDILILSARRKIRHCIPIAGVDVDVVVNANGAAFYKEK